MCILCALLTIPSIDSSASSQDELIDIKAHWAEQVILKWVSHGLAKGYGDGRFGPNDNITRAEFVTLLNRIFGYEKKSEKSFPDVKADTWYAGEIAKAYQAGIITGDSKGNMNPQAVISRQEAVVIITRAFSLTGDHIDAALKYTDVNQISDWALGAVGTMTKKGYVTGRPGNLFAPKANLTRSEAVKMIDNVMGELINTSGTYTRVVPGNMVVSSPGVTLKDTYIAGDLYLTEGIGNEPIQLIGVEIKGRTIVADGVDMKSLLAPITQGDTQAQATPKPTNKLAQPTNTPGSPSSPNPETQPDPTQGATVTPTTAPTASPTTSPAPTQSVTPSPTQGATPTPTQALTPTPTQGPTPTPTGEPEDDKTYYVDQAHPEASDENPGTLAKPWLTIQNGMKKVSAGDTLIVREGTYEEAVTTIVDGTESLPVTIKAYPGEKVAVDRFWVSHSNYTIEGLNILGTRYAAIYINKGVSNIKILGNTIDVAGGENVSAINCPGGEGAHSTNGLIIKGNTFGPSVTADTFCIRLRGYNHLITENTFNYWNGHDAICMLASETVISNNIFNSISHWAGSANHPDCIQLVAEENTIQNDVIVENNIFKNCSGQGIRMYQNQSGNQYCPNWTIRGNLFINIGAKALQARGDNCRVYNNLFYLSTVNTGHPLGFLSDNTNSAVYNNMFIGCGSSPNSKSHGWWNDDPSTPVEHWNNYLAGPPASDYMAKSDFIENTGINGGNPFFANAHIDWAWADDNGDDYDGSNSSFEVNEADIHKFKVNEFIEYSSFIHGADGIARKIVSIKGNVVYFEPHISEYTSPDCNVEKPGHFPDGDICNVFILLWGEQDWQPGDLITPDYSTALQPDAVAPSVPTEFTATVVSPSAINLSWSASTDNVGVVGYKIYRDDAEIDSINSTSYSDTGLKLNTQYHYTVAAYDAAGNVSSKSRAVVKAASVSYNDAEAAVNSS